MLAYSIWDRIIALVKESDYPVLLLEKNEGKEEKKECKIMF